MMLVNRTSFLRPASRQPCLTRRPAAPATNTRRSLWVLRAQTSDDSDAMGEDNFVGGRPQQENVFTGGWMRALSGAAQ
jgi:hypothetical protein